MSLCEGVWIFLCILCISLPIYGFNLEPRLPVIKRGVKNTYFGYSVAEHQILDTSGKVIEQVLLVGAPRASTGQPGTNHSGSVYKCPLSTITNDCSQIEIDHDTQPPEKNVLKDDQWLGVTVKSQGPGGYVLACAHRYIQKGPDYQWGQGICYSLTQFLDLHRAWEPCYNRPVQKAHEQFGYCQAGTSGDISEGHDLVIGSPGPYTWRGTVFANNVRFSMRDDKTWYMGPLLDENAPVDKYSYLGVSVTSGKFFGDETSFVGGAPRGNGTGQVVFFTKQVPDSTFSVQLVLSGEQFASSYGYSVASMDLNADGYLDLIVGAPFYYDKNIGGAVYIYLNSMEGLNESTVPVKLTGVPESQFGFSIASTGDINKDGYPDLAIGAPYDGNGAVYIYLGSAEGITTEPSQVIKVADLASEARHSLTSFGYSLSGGMDLDSNSYPDLLIGAYDSDTVILLRSRPIIDIITSVKGNLTNIDPSSQGCPEDRNATLVCFSFEACFQFNSSVLSHGTAIKLSYRIEAETFTGKKYYRVKFKNPVDPETPNIVKTESVVSGRSLFEPHCFQELVYLKEKTDIQTPIQFKLTYALIQREPHMAAPGEELPDINRYPILNQKEASKVFEAKFLKNCGADDICESDLHVSADLNLPKEKGIPVLYLGEQQVNLSVWVYNSKEPAYDATLYVTHSSTLSYVGRKVVKGEQVECIPFNGTVLKCEVGNPMNKGEAEFQIRFSYRGVSDTEKSLKFELKANTTSIEVTPEPDLILIADIVRVAELELRGVSYPEQIFYGGDVLDESDIVYMDEVGSFVLHTYEVINYGPWHAKEVNVRLSWPYQEETHNGKNKWLLYLIETPQVHGNGYCQPAPHMINPLRLQAREEVLIVEEDDDDSFYTVDDEEYRKKREIAPEEMRMEGKTVKVVTMDCNAGTARCYDFSCVIRGLERDQTALIKIRARLWNHTFVKDYPTVDWVSVLSRAHIYLDPGLDIKQRTDNDYAVAETKAYPDLPLYQKPEEIPLWIIILAICGGLLLLIILIICLWKLGFFKRRKPGYVLTETSEKEKEANNI